MRDYHNKLKHVKYLGFVTGEEFQIEYAKIAQSEDKVPIASTRGESVWPDAVPGVAGENLVRTQWWIHYETTHDPAPNVGKKEESKPKLNLNL